MALIIFTLTFVGGCGGGGAYVHRLICLGGKCPHMPIFIGGGEGHMSYTQNSRLIRFCEISRLRFLFALFRPSAGKELSVCIVICNVVFSVCIPFPFVVVLSSWTG